MGKVLHLQKNYGDLLIDDTPAEVTVLGKVLARNSL